jgi:hypothetical protein
MVVSTARAAQTNLNENVSLGDNEDGNERPCESRKVSLAIKLWTGYNKLTGYSQYIIRCLLFLVTLLSSTVDGLPALPIYSLLLGLRDTSWQDSPA